MTRDELIRMARESGWQYADGDDGYDPLWRFAALVAAAERKACANICDCLENDMVSGRRTKDGDQAALTAAILSERIRAKGQE